MPELKLLVKKKYSYIKYFVTTRFDRRISITDISRLFSDQLIMLDNEIEAKTTEKTSVPSKPFDWYLKDIIFVKNNPDYFSVILYTEDLMGAIRKQNYRLQYEKYEKIHDEMDRELRKYYPPFHHHFEDIYRLEYRIEEFKKILFSRHDTFRCIEKELYLPLYYHGEQKRSRAYDLLEILCQRMMTRCNLVIEPKSEMMKVKWREENRERRVKEEPVEEKIPDKSEYTIVEISALLGCFTTDVNEEIPYTIHISPQNIIECILELKNNNDFYQQLVVPLMVLEDINEDWALRELVIRLTYFVLAHELGHMAFRNLKRRLTRKERETLANWFASILTDEIGYKIATFLPPLQPPEYHDFIELPQLFNVNKSEYQRYCDKLYSMIDMDRL